MTSIDSYLKIIRILEDIKDLFSDFDKKINRNEAHLFKQLVIHTILVYDVVYFDCFLEKKIKNLIQNKRIKDINDCENKEDIIKFIEELIISIEEHIEYNQ